MNSVSIITKKKSGIIVSNISTSTYSVSPLNGMIFCITITPSSKDEILSLFTLIFRQNGNSSPTISLRPCNVEINIQQAITRQFISDVFGNPSGWLLDLIMEKKYDRI